jgi:hypothetical protein
MKIFAAIILALSCLVADAANVRLYFQSNTNASVLDTNYLIATPISSNIRADGGVVARGVPVRINQTASGIVTQSFNTGWFSISNRALARGIVINVFDSSSTLYDLTNVLESGFNTYVKTVYGTNPPPTYDELTNAFGYVPLNPASGTNAWTAADTVVSNALSDRLIATNDILFSLIQTATNTGITAATATNISANQALIVSNGLVPFVASKAGTNAPTIYDPVFRDKFTVQTVGLTGMYVTNSAESVIEFRGTDDDLPRFSFDSAGGFTLNVGPFNGDGSGLTKLNLATNAVNATNIYGAGLASMTNAAVTWANTASNALSIRLINTNNSLITQFGAADTVVSNGVVAAYTAADTIVSNGAVAYVTAATNFALRYIAQGTNIVLLTNGNTITVHSTATGSGGASGIATTDGSGTNTTLYFVNAAWGTNNAVYGTRGNITLAESNTIYPQSINSSILGGQANSLGTNTVRSAIAGGFSNLITGIASADFTNASDSFIGAGLSNKVYAKRGFIGAGQQNTAIGTNAAVVAGVYNAAYGNNSFIGGGVFNQISLGASNSVALGASNIITDNGYHSFVIGKGISQSYPHSFVWSDGESTPFSGTGTNQFLINTAGGVGINTNNPSGQALKVIGTTASDNYTVKDLSLLTATTNVIRVAGAGSASANGTYTWAGAAHYTNSASAELRLTNNTAGNWQLKSNTVVLYSSTAQVAATWILQSGALAVPTSVYGAYENMDGLRILGHVSSTNLDSRFTVSSAAVATNDSRPLTLSNSSSSILIGSLAVSNATYSDFSINRSGSTSVGVDSYGNNFRMFPGSGGSYMFHRSSGAIFSDIWGNNNYYKILLGEANFPGLWLFDFGFATPNNSLQEGGVAVNNIAIHGGSGGALYDLPIRPEQNAEMLEYPPTFITSWTIPAIRQLDQTDLTAQLTDSSTNGLLYAFTNAGMPLWYHMDGNVMWLTNYRVAGQLAIDADAFPSGTNFLRWWQTNGWKFSLTHYSHRMPTNGTVYVSNTGNEVVAGTADSVPAMTPDSAADDINSYYNWGLDMYRGSDTIGDTGYQRYWPRVIANLILNPKGQNYRHYWKDQYQQEARALKPMAFLWLTPRLGEKDGEAYSQANVVNHDFRDNGYGAWLGSPTVSSLNTMSFFRSMQTNEVPKLSKGHYGSGASFFGDVASVAEARWQLTGPLLQWGLINLNTHTNYPLASFMPNVLSQITNAGWLAMRKDVADKCYIVRDAGISNSMVAARRLANQDIAVAIWNEAGASQTITFSWEQLGVPDSQFYFARDVWNSTNMTAYNKSMSLTLGAREVRLLRLSKCEVYEDGWESVAVANTGGFGRTSPSSGTLASPAPNSWQTGVHALGSANAGSRIPVPNWVTNVTLEFSITADGVGAWTNLIEPMMYSIAGRTYNSGGVANSSHHVEVGTANTASNLSYSITFPHTNSYKVVGFTFNPATNTTATRYAGPTLRRIYR